MPGSPMPVAARSNAWVCGSLRAGIVVRIAPGHECLSVVNIVCCQVEVSASGRSLVQSSHAEWLSLSVIVKPQQ
jgi:hypothetical protein